MHSVLIKGGVLILGLLPLERFHCIKIPSIQQYPDTGWIGDNVRLEIAKPSGFVKPCK